MSRVLSQLVCEICIETSWITKRYHTPLESLPFIERCCVYLMCPREMHAFKILKIYVKKLSSPLCDMGKYINETVTANKLLTLSLCLSNN